MSVDEIEHLLQRWEKLRKRGETIDPEALCRDCPQHLDELRRRIQARTEADPAQQPTLRTPGSNPPPTTDPTGATKVREIAGYQILEELGSGGMGVVYRAYQPRLDRVVALKMLLSGTSAGSWQRTRFQTEAEAVAQLQHPNIVQVYEVGEQDGCPFIAFEYVPGPALNQVLQESLPTPANAAKLVETLARAVHVAHERQILHRDLKPHNVLLAPDGTPKIADFGLAKRIDDNSGLTVSGDVFGTPCYMAPEQAEGRVRDTGPATDIYSLGAILYECLTGRPPFEAANPIDVLYLVSTAEPVSPSGLQPKIPRDLVTICLKCLQKKTLKRYVSALALAEDLRRFQEGEPIEARPVSQLERAAKWALRHPAVATLLVLCGSLLLTLLIGAWIANHNLRDSNEALRIADAGNRSALINLNVTNGSHYLQDNDLLASLIWYARGLRLEENPARQEMHRIRIAAVLDSCPEIVQFWTHPEAILDAQISPDGKWVASASADNTARVWNATTGQARCEMPLVHEGDVLHARFRADGERLITSGAEGVAKIWDVSTGHLMATLAGHEAQIRDARFSPNGRRVVTASDDRTARVWDAETGRLIGKPLPHDGEVVCALFHPDGERILTASSDGSARLWPGSVAGTAPARFAQTGPLTDACFDPTGRLIATASEDRTARLWDVATGQSVGPPLKHLGVILHVAFRHDGEQLVTASEDMTAKVWDTRTGQALAPVLWHHSVVTCAAFSPDGRHIVTGSDDNTARVWDAASGRAVTPPLPHNGTLSAASFTPDSRRIATAAADGSIRMYELDAPQPRVPLLRHPPALEQAHFNLAGDRVLTLGAAAEAILWNCETGEQIATLSGHTQALLDARYSFDGRWIVTASADTTARLWDADTGQLRHTLKGHHRPVRVARFSSDATRVVTASDDGTARIWNATTGDLLTVLQRSEDRHPLPLLTAAFSPDGQRVATGGRAGLVQLWNADTGETVGTAWQHARRVSRVAFTPDSRAIASASFDQTVKLRDVSTGQSLLPEQLRHAGPVRDVCFRPDGRTFLTTGDDNTARVWATATGAAVVPPMIHHGSVTHGNYSADGLRIVTASSDSTARVWDAATGQPLTPELQHAGAGRITWSEFDQSGNRVVTASENGTAQVWELRRDDWPAEDLERLAELLGGIRIGEDSSSHLLLTAEVLHQNWKELRERYHRKMHPQ